VTLISTTFNQPGLFIKTTVSRLLHILTDIHQILIILL